MATSDENHSIQLRLNQRLESAPDDRAWTFVDKKGSFTWSSFADFYKRSGGAAAILSENGLKAGDVCVLVLQSDERAATTLMGCLLAGAVPLLVAPPIVHGLHSNLDEIVSNVVGRTNARLVIHDIAPEVREPAGETLNVSALFEHETDLPKTIVRSSDDIALMQLTSGTTGFPRICVWRHEGVLAALDGMQAAMAVGSDDIFVNWTPLYHDMGLVNNFLLCMVKAIPLVMLEPTSFIRKPSRWLRALSDTEATTTWSPNFGFAVATQRVAEEELEGVRLDKVRGFWNAAERVHLQTILSFHERFADYGVALDSLKINFGCAENVGGATFTPPRERFVAEHVHRHALHNEGVALPVPEPDETTASIVGVGRPYPGMSIDILDEAGEKLPDGHVGEIALRTPSRMDGYLKDPESSARCIKGDLLLTGDFGYLRAEELFWTGRVRERINIFGKKYDPSDFEAALLEVDGLRAGCFAAFGVDDESTGTQRLVIVTEVSDPKSDPRSLVDRVIERVSLRIGVGVDKVILLAKGTMSKTSSGKRRHRHYRELYENGELEELERGVPGE